MNTSELSRRYISLFGLEPARPGAVHEIERSLRISLPDDFIEIAAFYAGGIVGGISHHAIESQGPATNIMEETTRLRKQIGLPDSLIVLAEPAESLVVMDTAADCGLHKVIWLDATDAPNLQFGKPPRNPDVWKSYSGFFWFLLDREQEDRGDV